MAAHEAELKVRLGRVRLRWRLTAAFRGLLLVATEALGVFLLVLLADLIYDFSGKVLLGLWAVGGAVLAVLLARHVIYPLLRRISDEQIALLIEERAEQAQGAVISAVECSRQQRKGRGAARPAGLYGFLVNFLVDDAVARIDRTPLRVVSNLRRLRKHVLIALGLLVVFVATTLTFPKWSGRGQRVLTPWVRIAEEKELARIAREEKAALEAQLYGPISFEVAPGDVKLLRGRGLRVQAKLSRTPPEAPVLLCRPKAGGDWEPLRMWEVTPRSYGYDLNDINESMEYLVTAARQESKTYNVEVYDRLAIRGIELTYHYPQYLELEAKPAFGLNGDIEVPAGTKVDLRVVANNPLKAGKLIFDEKKTLELVPGATAADGAKTSFPVDSDSTYSLTVTDVYGDTLASDQFYYVKVKPDNPPAVELVAPKVDMSVHPLCEVTFKAKVSDDFGIKEAVVKANVHRGEKATPLSFPMKLSDELGQTKNVKDGTGEYVLQLEDAKPAIEPGDMVFYYVEASDRKGQQVKTDVFYIKMWPLEVAATWPTSVAPPDLPHETFNDPMDLMLFLAAAWNLEQQRGQIPQGEFNAKSEKIAQRMEVGDPPDFAAFWGHGGAPEGGGPDRERILEVATKQIETAHGLLKVKHEPGQAADHMRVALAMVETLATDKRLLALELNPEPLHTGQPSSGHADDPVMEQIAFRPPSTMTDSLTAFQQPDNPPRLLPPDYRRALRIKERKAFRTKQLRIADEIYATEEQLVEMAREQLGHIQLREAIDDNTPNDPAQQAGGGEEIRVDKRAIPYKEMVTADERRGDVAMAEKQTLSEPKVDRIKDPLKYDRIADNQRRGGSNPYMTQAPGGGGGEQDEEEQQRPERMDEDALRQMRQRIMARRPPQQGGGGGGEPMPQGMEQPGEMNPQQGGSAGPASLQQMANWQAQLAQAAGQVARDIAQSMEPGDRMSREALGGMREASAQMERAADSFRRGDVRGGVDQARRAQGMLRSAMNRLQASQYDSLEQAIAAAQDGAAAMVANQWRISQGTEQVARRVGEITGEAVGRASEARPGERQPGQGQPAQAQPGQAQPGQGQPGQAQPGQAQPGQAQPGQAQPGQGQPGQAQPGQGQPTRGSLRAPSRQAVDKAAASDPRIGPQLKGLAAEQGKLAQDLDAFMSYVQDLKKWAGEATKDRVAGSLDDVNKNLRRDSTPQKMVDAAIGLAGRDIQSAASAQEEIGRSLDKMASGVQEAAEILAGSPTGVLRRAARDAREVGERVAAIAGGSGGEGQPGRTQPGQRQPGQGQPGQAEPGKGEPGQAQPGQGQPGQGEPGKAEPAKGEPGQAQPGQGEPGKGQPSEGQQPSDLAQALAGQQGHLSGEPSDQASAAMGGGGPGSNQEIGELWMKTRRLTDTLEREQLADQQAIGFMKRRSADINTFRKMFELAQKAEAMKFSQVALNVGAGLEEALEEALSAKRLHAEQREECPPKYREFVNAYFEALSKATSDK